MEVFEYLPLGLSVASVVFSVITYRKTVVHDRKQATIDAFNRLQEQVFDKLNMYEPSKIREISEDSRSAEYKTISSYIARIEHFCVGVRQKIYDRNTVYKLAHGYFDGGQIRSRIEPIIEKKNKNSDEDYYSNIRFVLDWMKKESEKGKVK